MAKPTIPMRTIAALVIGNAFEWYDFMVYSYMTLFIAALFFPNIDRSVSLLAATATFGVAFCMRPLGGIFFGILADKKGRKLAVTVVMALMTIAMLMIATAHTFAQVGIIAPFYILIARLIQGFSAGGEFGPSTALLIELSPPGKRGFYGSLQMFGQCFAILLGGLVGFLMTTFLTMQQIIDWGWRLPFIFGLAIAPIGVYIRHHLHEETIFSQTIATSTKQNLLRLLQQHVKDILLSIGLIVGGTASVYSIISFLPTYATKFLKLPVSTSFEALGVASLTLVLFTPLFGYLADKIGRKKVMVTALTCYLMIIYPVFSWLVNSPDVTKVFITEFIFCVCLAAYFGPFTVITAELFPRAIRATGLSISNNIAVMTFGGFGQFIVTWLIKMTGSSIAPAYYLLPTVAISLIAAILLPADNRTITNENPGMALATSSD